jgi:hypothetical protein
MTNPVPKRWVVVHEPTTAETFETIDEAELHAINLGRHGALANGRLFICWIVAEVETEFVTKHFLETPEGGNENGKEHDDVASGHDDR